MLMPLPSLDVVDEIVYAVVVVAACQLNPTSPIKRDMKKDDRLVLHKSIDDGKCLPTILGHH